MTITVHENVIDLEKMMINLWDSFKAALKRNKPAAIKPTANVTIGNPDRKRKHDASKGGKGKSNAYSANMNVSDTAANATAITATSYWGNSRFTADGVAYLKRQRDEGVTARAEHAAQRKRISEVFNCSETSVKNWFNNNSKPAGSQRSANESTQPAAISEMHSQSELFHATLENSEHPQPHSVTPLSELNVADARAALRKQTETAFQIFKREEADVFRTVTLPEHDSTLKGRARRKAMLRLASKAISEKWRNLGDEQRAVFETKASAANAEPLELLRNLDSDQKDKLCGKSLVQMGKILGVLEALGWSFMFAAINEETHATFKEVKAAKLADLKYLNAKLGLETQLTASLMLSKSHPAVAKSVTTNKSVQQSRMEQLALYSLNECLAKTGLQKFSTFPWSQVQSKQLLNRSFHFIDWPANIPLKRNLTIENCEIIIRMFERRMIRGSIGLHQHESGGSGEDIEFSDPSFDIENVQLPDSATLSGAGLGEMSFVDFLNNDTV
ncbi:hypothetical protein HDU77_009174 [Chytriomyces hyalinus]|nr:hypothetical protein HDU77_009174 [Chytriomyces hyalinus]